MTIKDPFVRTQRAIDAAKKKPGVVPLLKQLDTLKLDKRAALTDGIVALRTVLGAMRWDNQGGYVGYSERKHKGSHWAFVSTSLQVAPGDLDALFSLAGIKPDEIAEGEVSCATCGNAMSFPDGTREERGYTGPCAHCARPLMSHWVPVGSLIKRKDGKPWLPK